MDVVLFKKDCEYYDKEQNELKAMLSVVDFKKTDRLADLGAGIGRLAIPLSKYVKVVALDSNKQLLNEIKDTNIEKINKKIEDYFPDEKFDYALIAWPQFENVDRILKHVKKDVLKSSGKLIIVKVFESDLRYLVKELFPKRLEKKGFLKILGGHFKVIKEKKFETLYEYPDLNTGVKMVIFDFESFWDSKAGEKQKSFVVDFLKRKVLDSRVVLKAKMKVLLCG
ncbi:methyltransferase domain-containing protein [Candidatus Woesearchaeota archaeon]|nr:methyltransferase domain-containing protein [Candidatus Woesearchaeota archaeon]MBW3021612.1 methyltransferase domain-containing protein [Candidatus Woesearchaeota archaeon]